MKEVDGKGVEEVVADPMEVRVWRAFFLKTCFNVLKHELLYTRSVCLGR